MHFLLLSWTTFFSFPLCTFVMFPHCTVFYLANSREVEEHSFWCQGVWISAVAFYNLSWKCLQSLRIMNTVLHLSIDNSRKACAVCRRMRGCVGAKCVCRPLITVNVFCCGLRVTPGWIYRVFQLHVEYNNYCTLM